ncbi:MAG: sensor histidine kinase [Bacteroidales bacterium]|nr:sensor histidine kinase [Bacteroidales bacterium]
MNNDLDSAAIFLEKANLLSELLNEKKLKYTILNVTSEMFEKKGNYKKALEVYKDYSNLKDTVHNEKKSQQIATLQTRYETEKKEQQIAFLENEKELGREEIKRKALQRTWSIVFILVAVIIVIILFYYYRKTKSAKNKIEILQREIHHRVKNNLSIIKRLVEVTGETISDAKASNNLHELSNRIISISQVHSQLYRKDDITHVNLNVYITDLLTNLQTSLGSSELKIELQIENKIDVGFSNAVPLGLIINELVTNAIKYGRNNNKSQEVLISIKNKGEAINITVQDNGPGFPENFDIISINTYGLKLVKGLTLQLNGQIKVFNNSGAVVEIEIPMEK